MANQEVYYYASLEEFHASIITTLKDGLDLSDLFVVRNVMPTKLIPNIDFTAEFVNAKNF